MPVSCLAMSKMWWNRMTCVSADCDVVNTRAKTTAVVG